MIKYIYYYGDIKIEKDVPLDAKVGDNLEPYEYEGKLYQLQDVTWNGIEEEKSAQVTYNFKEVVE